MHITQEDLRPNHYELLTCYHRFDSIKTVAPTAATALLYCLAPDTLYLPTQALHLLELTGACNPAATLRDALANGWLVQEATHIGEISYSGRCWLPTWRVREPHTPTVEPVREEQVLCCIHTH